MEGKDAKNRNEAKQPYSKDLALCLAELFEGKPPSDAAFNLPSKYNMAKMLRADVEAAGLETEGEDRLPFTSSPVGHIAQHVGNKSQGHSKTHAA
ncbi:hypothetical protein KS4_14930 [Poriferisphaera corsica]|uniref:Uncharacterized protein n=1 Tax=Poriferisphaera corsica TaxID=2528020 RepID=A0A517YT96_9BACT|nr:hypothetical protein KS4_14930 [Poriferisphaera corsica]